MLPPVSCLRGPWINAQAEEASRVQPLSGGVIHRMQWTTGRIRFRVVCYNCRAEPPKADADDLAESNNAGWESVWRSENVRRERDAYADSDNPGFSIAHLGSGPCPRCRVAATGAGSAKDNRSARLGCRRHSVTQSTYHGSR